MQINPDFNISAYTIRSYEPKQINIYTPLTEEEIRANMDSPNREPIHHTVSLDKPFIVYTEALVPEWNVSTPQALTLDDFKSLVELDIEILILGTGASMFFPDPQIMAFVQQHRIGMEVMTTESACRTYNFLVSDERKVAAALFMIDPE